MLHMNNNYNDNGYRQNDSRYRQNDNKHRERRSPMSSAKSAYEIRASLLELAFKIATQKHNAEAQARAGEQGTDCYISTAPTTAEIVAEAEKLNAFVSTQSNQR